jgi:hypothetical protein
MSYIKQRVTKLRKEVEERGLSDKPAALKKAELVALLLEDDKSILFSIFLISLTSYLPRFHSLFPSSLRRK